MDVMPGPVSEERPQIDAVAGFARHGQDGMRCRR
jgi:hypothetical protein